MRKAIRLAAPLALFVALVPGFLAVPRAQAAGPSLTVSPAKELAAGQYIKVTWSNLPEATPIYLRQCPVNPPSVRFCDQLRTPGFADADGGGSLVFPVVSPYTNVTPKGEPTKNSAKCDVKHACAIALFLDKNATDVKKAVYAKFQFEPTQTACPAGGLPSEGTGAGGPFRAFLRWEGRICKAADPVDLNYVLKTSVGGLQDFAHALTTFGTTTIPFSAAGVTPPAGAEYKFAPLTESGLVFGYRMFDHQPFGNLGDQITTLRLTPDLLAKIFTGQIANWNDPQILALNPQYDPSQNPGHGLPPLIRAFGRGDACDESYLLTSWFENVAKATYEAGGGAGLPYKAAGITTTMPSTGDTTLVTGSTALGQETAFASSNNDPYQYGFIGYMDSSTAAQFGLQTVQIQNPAGKWVSATPSSIAAAVSDMKETDGVLQPDFGTQDPNAYPMPVVSYAVTRQNVPDGVSWDGDTGKGLQTFLDWAAGDGQKDLPDGYVPLTAALAAQTTDAAKGVPGGSDTNSPPPTTPPPTTSAPGGPGGSTDGSSPSTSASTGSPSSESTSSPTDQPTVLALPPGAAGPGASLVAATTRLILPMLLVLMLGALLVGPAMTWFGKRRAKTAAASAGPGGGAESDGSMKKRLRMPGRKRR